MLFLAAPNFSAAYDSVETVDPVDRIQCPPGYVVTVYAEGLASPDGLALSPEGVLHVAEEASGRVSRVNQDRSVSPVLTGLQNPEGIAFDDQGNLYVVEDVAAGRLIRRAEDGTISTLSTNRDAPEGVVWAPNGRLYITESNVQFASSPLVYETSVTQVYAIGGASQVRTDAFFWSYAGIVVGPEGFLYVTNEASGTGTNDSIFILDPISGSRTLFVSGLKTPEGLRFSPGGRFPLYVAEEGDGNVTGRLSRVEADGEHIPFCTGLLDIEDVVLDTQGRLYVSEDGSGSVILIEPTLSLSQAAVPPNGSFVAPRDSITYTLVLTNNSFSELTGLVLTDTLPLSAELSPDSVSVPDGWGRVDTPPSAIVLTGDLAVNESVKFRFGVTVAHGSSGTMLENKTEAQAHGFDGVSSIITHTLFVPPARRHKYLPLFLSGLGFAAPARGRRRCRRRLLCLLTISTTHH